MGAALASHARAMQLHASGSYSRSVYPLMNDRAIGRGAFLGLLGAGALGLFFSRDITRAVRSALPSGVREAVPSSDGWRIYQIASTMPDISVADFRLTIGGMVRRPVTLSMDELQSVGRTAQISDFHCVTGWSVYDVRWVGVTMSDLLDHVGADRAAGGVRFVSAERPYEDSLTQPQARLGDVMLAWEMDGAPLRREHGGPLRLVMPPMYGYKSVKWVTEIELVPEPRPGFWELNGYDADAWVGDSNGL